MLAAIAPGALWSQVQQGYEEVSPLLFRVEFGVLTIHAEGPIGVVRRGATQPQTIPAHVEVTLHAGESGFSPGDTLSTWRNDGVEPVRLIVVKLAVVGYDTHTVLPEGVTRMPLIEQRAATEPMGPVVVTLREVTLPP